MSKLLSRAGASSESSSCYHRVSMKPLKFRPHPWHGLNPGPRFPEIVQAYVELTPTDGVKYEIDKISGYLKVDDVNFRYAKPAKVSAKMNEKAANSSGHYSTRRSSMTAEIADFISRSACSHSSVSSLYRGSPTLGPFAIAS